MIVHHSKSRGFSLVELMFSMAIGSIILILASTMLRTSGDGYERVGGNVATEREARAVISQLSLDLSTAVFHKDEVITKSSEAWAADRVGFLSLQPKDAQTLEGRIGDLCAVNYYMKDLTIGSKTVRCLMRGFRESQETFDAVRNGSLSPLFSEKTSTDEPVAFGVVSFEARPRARNSSGTWIDWVKNDTTGPEAFDVKLVVARRELSSKLSSAADWNGGGAGGKLIGSSADVDKNANLEVYATTIRFGNHAKP